MYDINKGDHFPQFCDLQVLEDKYGGGGGNLTTVFCRV